MKFAKSSLFLALFGGLSFSALADVDVYGKANVTVQSSDDGEGSFTEIKSNNSRFGLKGSEKISEGLEAVYKFEFGVDVSDADSKGDNDDNITARNQYVGVKGSFGQVVIGRNDTAMKQSQGKVDLFNDYDGDIKSAISKSDKRKGNTVQYNTPNMAGFVATVANISSEVDGGKDGLSSSLTFSKDKFYAAAAYDSDVRAEDVNVIRLVAQYSVADITLGALWESEDGDASTENDGWIASAAYKATSDVTLKAQYGQSDIVADEAKTYSLGADYKLAKTAKVFAFVTSEEFGDDTSNDYYAVGTEFKF